MFPSATLPPAGGLARHCLAALAALTLGCTGEACAEAERRARLPLDVGAEGS